MKTLCFQGRLLAFAAVLSMAGNQGLTTEPTGIPSFHRLLLINETSRPAVARTESGLLTAAWEMRQPDGQWCAIARLRAPTAISNLELSAGEVWQFIVPESGSGSPAEVRLAVKVDDGIVYSEAFVAKVDLSKNDQTIDCWFARLRISPASPDNGSMIAVVGPAAGN